MARTTLNTLAPGENAVNLKNTVAHDGEIMTSHHDIATTEETVQHLLAGGTPDWVRFPHEWKNYAREAFQREKEISDEQVDRYKMEDQDDLTNHKARMVNPMSTERFIYKLREYGIKCFTVYNGLQGTVALWCLPPRLSGKARYVCYLRTPFMYEWSVLVLDNHHLPKGEIRGWRTVMIELIKNEILTEWQAHQIFGHASENSCFRRYRESLWEIRNGKRYTEEELNEKKDIQIMQ